MALNYLTILPQQLQAHYHLNFKANHLALETHPDIKKLLVSKLL